MATADFSYIAPAIHTSVPTVRSADEKARRPLHRIRTVRLEQGISLRTVARRTGIDIRQLRLQEQESTDLRLSDLHKWQKALEVPLTDLLVEPEGPLSRPVMERAHMIRVMKTAAAIREQSPTPAIQRMAQMLSEQLTEIMPELAEVGAWPSYGQPRRLDDYGRAADRCLSEDSFFDSDEEAA